MLLPEVRGGRTTCAASSPQAAELASFLAGLFNAAGCLDAASLDVAGSEEGGEAGGGSSAAAGAKCLEAEGADAAAAPRRRRRVGAAPARWALQVDVLCTSYDGNVADAAVLAAGAALRSTVFPSADAPAAARAAGPRFLRLPVALTLARVAGGGLGLVSDPSASNGEDAPSATFRAGWTPPAAAESLATAGVTVVVGVARGASASAPDAPVVGLRLQGGAPALSERELAEAILRARARARLLAGALWEDTTSA